MVSLHIDGQKLELEVQGWHKLWAFKRKIDVPLDAIVDVRRKPGAIRGWWKGLRVPGTHLPGVIVAGTYFKDGQREFWDVGRGDEAIVIELAGHRYDRLVVDVEDPDQTVERIRQAQQQRAAHG